MKKELHLLTALRGFAALWVVFHHAGSALVGVDFSSLSYLSVVIERGWLGVDMFFILSGFIIAFTYFEKFVVFNLPNAKKFWMKRFARIYPVHIFTLFLFVILITVTTSLGLFTDNEGKYTLEILISQIFLLHGIGLFTDEGWNLSSWSVSSEFLAYLLFPLMPLFFKKIEKPLYSFLMIIVIFAVAIYAASVMNQGQKFMLNIEYSWFRVLSEFSLGILLYNISKQVKYSSIYYLIAGLGFAGIFFQSMVASSFYDFCYLIYFMMIIFSLGQLHVSNRIPLFSWLGEISYSVYLTHVLVIIVLNQILRKVPQLAEHTAISVSLLVILSCLLGGLTYHFIEGPMRKKIIEKMLKSKPVTDSLVASAYQK